MTTMKTYYELYDEALAAKTLAMNVLAKLADDDPDYDAAEKNYTHACRECADAYANMERYQLSLKINN